MEVTYNGKSGTLFQIVKKKKKKMPQFLCFQSALIHLTCSKEAILLHQSLYSLPKNKTGAK